MSDLSKEERNVLEDLRVLTAELVEYMAAARESFPVHAYRPEDERSIGQDMAVIGRRLKEIADQHERERACSGIWVSCPVEECSLGRVPAVNGDQERCEKCFGTGSVRSEDAEVNTSTGLVSQR
ncbi:hypothetical protein ABZ816_27235 [Actinosynnema sp. NPDC047251]|uniref:Uncharacterized protein n=1 Tax=Saccharothrix espanaensis (strain ATCC 51144 / DSM 44229 / JCM 9112 / NBRC 15066 / NRRL 15764) TaxID=1179773 RepID=K0JPH2_SACES|nr:hypothetical protein [Saccharothrix espanaensis]CCH28695.1 hypothetical protein BN6_13690 [Saccharothrix espanaensis DSM 44229]